MRSFVSAKIGNFSLFAKLYLIVAVMGIIIAIYDAYDYLTISFNFCNVSSTISCLGVFQSGHTSLFGIPFWLMGLIWFPLALSLAILTLQEIAGRNSLNGSVIVPFLMIGNIFTIYLWYLELDLIHVICPVCASLYIVNYTMTALAAIEFFRLI